MGEQDKDVAQTVLGYYREASEAKLRRMSKNQKNFDTYNLNGDFSHKRKGQSQEFLPKMQMAVDQIASFLTQGLMDQTDSGGWFDVSFQAGYEPKTLTSQEWNKLLRHELDEIDYASFFQDTLKSGLLGSLMISKIHGENVNHRKYVVRETTDGKRLARINKTVWRLKAETVRQEDYYPDPSGAGLYEIHDIEMDLHTLVEIAEARPDIFDMEAVNTIPVGNDSVQEHKKSRETDQNIPVPNNRKKIRVLECWGTLVGPDGKVSHRDVVTTITHDGIVIRPPMPIDLWDGDSPFVTSPIIRVPNSVWHRALMDAASNLNIAQNELFNLMLDGGIMAVFGIKQVRMNWLENPEEVEDGIPPGTTLGANASCPPGGKVLERVDTGTMSGEALSMYSLIDRESQSSALSNDIRTGNLPSRAVKATEIVAANQTIDGIFNGMVKYIDNKFCKPTLKKALLNMAANFDEMPREKIKSVLGFVRAEELSKFANEDIFADLANGMTLKVFGLTDVINRVNDFRKITTLLQTIGGNQDLMQEFRLKYSIEKFLGEIIKNLGIDLDKIKADPAEQERARAMMMASVEAQAGASKGMSQVPSADVREQSGLDQFQAEMQQGMSSGDNPL